MRKALVIWFFVAALVAMGCSPPHDNSDSFGSVGTLQDSNSWIEIWNWHDLDAVRNNLSGNYILMTDLDSTSAGYDELASPTANDGNGWEPIGYLRLYHDEDGKVTEVAERFEGTFDGRGYEIRDLFSNHPDDWAVGLFGAVAREGVIQDLRVVHATVTGYRHVGGLVGENIGTITNCFSTGSIIGLGEIGGLVGHNKQGNITNSSSAASVVGDWLVGGLVGWTQGYVYDSHSAGTVTGERGVGGLVGQDSRIVSNSYYSYDEVLINGQNVISIGALFEDDFQEWLANDRFLDVDERLSKEDDYYIISDVGELKELLAFGQDDSLRFRLTSDLDLSAEPDFYIPYLRGEFDGNGHRISNLSFKYGFVSQVGLFGYVPYGGEVTGVGAENVEITGHNHVGGLVGDSGGGSIVSNSYSTGSVTGSGRVGGLVGFNWGGPISNSYSTANVTGDSSEAGGLVGDNRGQVTNSYSSGSVTSYWSVGGLIGHNSGAVSSCYATGSVVGTSGGKYVGGLVGWGQYGTVSNSFWDIETSGMDVSDGGTGKTTAEMKDIATFLDAGWDIGTTTLGDLAGGYPFLSWQFGNSPTWLIHEGISPIQYDLTISSTAGGVVTIPGEGAFPYDSGTQVNLVATGDNGYEFVNWTGDVGTVGSVDSAETTITMNGDYSITANFEESPAVQYSLTISSTAGGSVTTPGEGIFPYGVGTVVNLVATPAMGHHFANWTGDVSTMDNVNSASTTITMNGDCSIVANFEPVAGVQTLCVESATGTGEVCITTSHGFVEDLVALPSVPPAPPADIVFPHGMFSFQVTGLELGQTVTITVELPDPVPSGTRWWKEHMGAWYSVPVQIIGPNTMRITLTDGVFPGDSDGAEDGVITDPGGPGYPMAPFVLPDYVVGWDGSPVSKATVLWPLIILLAAIATAAGLLVLRRPRAQI